MLLNIETKGATNIIINMPSEEIRYAQNVIDIFEKNAVFVNKGYSDISIVTPTSTLVLGESVKFNTDRYGNDGEEFEVVGKGVATVEDRIPATPDSFLSVAKLKKEFETKVNKLQEEKKFLEMQVNNLKEEIESFKNEEEI